MDSKSSVPAKVAHSLRFIAGLADVIVPPQCVFCNQPTGGDSICGVCHQRLDRAYYRCDFCAAPLPAVVPNHDCLKCRGKRWRFSKVLTLGVYSSPLSDIVVEMKQVYAATQRRIIGGHLGEIVRARAESLGSSTNRPIVLPVPNHWTHRFTGAANTAWELSQSVADRAGLDCKSGLIRRIRRTAKQGTLPWSERSTNVRGAFTLRRAHRLSGRHVFLVDDVFTSGATAAEVTKVLLAGGASAVDIVVVARGTGIKTVNEPKQAP